MMKALECCFSLLDGKWKFGALRIRRCEDTGQGGRYRSLFYGNSPEYDECMLPLHMKDQHELNVRCN